MYTQRNFRIVSTLTALMICCLCSLFAYYANVPKPVSVEGTIGAQAIQQAYNSALEGILQQPKASTTAGGESKKTTDFTGATTIRLSRTAIYLQLDSPHIVARVQPCY